jgi:flagellar motor switch protein FliG
MQELALGGCTGAARAPSPDLNRRQKAAIIVRLLLAEGEQVPLSALSEDQQADLTEAMGSMRPIDHATLRAVVEEFLSEIEAVGLSFPGGLEGALGVLEGHISAATASRLRRRALVSGQGDPWARLAGLSPQQLLPMLEAESTEVGAVVMSKLSVSRAAELLGKLPGEKARRIARAIADTSAIRPETVQRIGLALVQQIEAEPPPAFDTSPVERVGAILNYSPASTRDGVLEGLDQEDAEFAAEVRRAIFTFSDIPYRIDPRDISKIMKAMENPVLVTALAAGLAGKEAEIKTADFFLSNMSQRMSGQLREEISDRGAVKAKEAEAAMSAVLAAIRGLEAKGEIVMITVER